MDDVGAGRTGVMPKFHYSNGGSRSESSGGTTLHRMAQGDKTESWRAGSQETGLSLKMRTAGNNGRCVWSLLGSQSPVSS